MMGPKRLSDTEFSFTVWAPLHEEMILHIVQPIEKKIKMKKKSDGFFHIQTKAEAGWRYFFMPDGKEDLADPASCFQPEGVHGPSEIIDHSTYQWKDKEWKGIPFDELILYELHTGTYTQEGSFEAIIGKLDHLADTGINAIELMPVAQFPGSRNWGYDGVYPYAVQNSYGGPEGLKKLVDACHQKGIAVFLDVVYNHLGPEGNYFERFGPYFTDHYRTPWGKAINFDGQWSDGVRDYFADNAVYWFEHFHIDGLRFDAIHGVYDLGAKHFWQYMHEKIRKYEQRAGRQLHTIAESDLNNPMVINTAECGGYGFTAQWLDDFHHAMYTLIHEEGKKSYVDFGDIRQLAKAYKEGFVHSGEYVSFRKRRYGASSAGIPGNKFVVFTDNHDQAGNRLTGDTLASLIDFERIKLAAASCLLSPYIPMLFMGEEYGDNSPFLYFISHSDKELIAAVREGRKKEFTHMGWEEEPADPSEDGTFHRSKLQWDKMPEQEHTLIHQWYKALISLRKTHPALKNFNKDDVWANTTENVLYLYRRSECLLKQLIIVFNFSGDTYYELVMPSTGTWNKILDSNDKEWHRGLNGAMSLPVHIESGMKTVITPLTVVVYENTGL